MNIKQMQKECEKMQKKIKEMEENMKKKKEKKINIYIENEIIKFNQLTETEKDAKLKELFLLKYNNIENSDIINNDLSKKIDLIHKANNIWYMNGNKKDLDNNPNDITYWNKYKKNGFVLTWNHNNQNDNIYTTLNKDDIICWHVVSGGYNSILRVNGLIHNITENEIDLLNNESEKIKWKQDMVKYNYKVIVIPVEFIESIDDKFIKYDNIENYNKDNWIHGFRGPRPIKPKNNNWKNQTIDMLKYMYNSNHISNSD